MSAALGGLEENRGPLPLRAYDCGKRCVVIVPTYNERENLEPIVRDILSYLVTDVLIVDDGSPDGTGQLADSIAAHDPRVHVMHRQGKLGLGTAYLAGFAWAAERGYERAFEMDADFSHPPWDLPRLAHASLDADLVIGSRYVPGGSTIGWDFKRRMLSRGANFYARLTLGCKVHDMTGGFRCFDVEKLMRLDLDSVNAQGYAFQIEMAYRMDRAGFRIVEIPIHFTDRRVGASKMDGGIAREALFLVPKLRFRVPRENR
ncbi:MAG: polyprenol monophosphomannose synthase [Planctomycetes bacterium]|nr:polyprenol monophosphomannose synthase [Planctomycetota bacterium]